jgi:tetratricopeptide (TPR) repeat protein
MSLPILPVYVSSTWLDLEPERKAVEQAVQRLRETKFVGMEYFGSRDENTRRASLDEVDRAAASGAYVGIFAARYGSGITEDEYRRARELGLRCFIYFKDDALIPADRREADPAQTARLDALKQELRANHIIGPDFKSPDDLAAKVTADLHRWLFDEYLTPKLQGALRGDVSRDEAQALLAAVLDSNALNRDLLMRLQGAGFNLSVGGDYAGRDVITNIYNAPAPAVSAPPVLTLHQLRAPVGDFVGREKEIAELTAALRGGASVAITGISGMGGIGKTELAFYVAERLRDTYPDAQLVLDMRGTDNPTRDPADALAACIRAFAGVEQPLPDDLPELTRIYRNTLDGKRALILLDNASDGAQARPLLPPAGSALLVTSRNVVTLPHMTRVTLEQLSSTEARKLLRNIAPRVPEDTADRICFLCGYLPLAIRAAGSLLDVTADLAPETYAEQLQDERRRLERIGAEGVDLSVEASFGLSYARLTPDAARVFRQLAVFPAFFDARAEETVCEDLDHKHLSELLRRNLVRYNADTQRYSLHDLARLFADSRMTDDERPATRMRHATHYLTVLGECSDLYLKGGDVIKSGLALFDVERRNIEAGQEWACRHSSGDDAAARLCYGYPDAGADVLTLRQHPRESISWFEAALAAARQLKDRASEGRHLGNLGNAYDALGEYQRAIEFHEQRLSIARDIGDRRGEGNALGNLGVVYSNLGEARRAVEFYEQQLIITRDMGDRRGEGSALGNLGIAYNNLGETRRGVEYHEQALVAKREIGDRKGEGKGLTNLGNAYINLGETRRAVEVYEQAVKIHRELGNRPSEAIALFNISLSLDELGDRAKAIAHAEVALEIFEQIESPHAERARAKLERWRGEA